MKHNQHLTLADWHKRYKQQANWSGDVRRYLFGKAAVKPKDKILEVGSGTGAVLSLLTNEIGGNCFGIDIDLQSILFSANRHSNMNHAAADGHHIPFPDASFSITYCHYLLLWIQNPLEILSEMKRVTKTGGYVIAMAEPDYNARIDFPPPLDELGKKQTKSLVEQGIDPMMGRKLTGLFHKAGLKEITAGILGAQWDMSQNQNIDKNEWMMIQSDLSDDLTLEALEGYRQAEARAREEGERILFIPTFYAAGMVP